MLRAKNVLAIVLSAMAILMLGDLARAGDVDLIDGVGLIDYRSRPKLEVGSWVRYRITSTNGIDSTNYEVTIVVAGEENFWGEDCFWLETWTKPDAGGLRPIASLISYAIFDDPEAYAYARYYARKSIAAFGPMGVEESVNRIPSTTLKSRDVEGTVFSFDTLGTETIENEMGSFTCIKYETLRHWKGERNAGDSTHTTISDDRRIDFWSDKVPITHAVRQDIDVTARRISLAAGESDDRAAEVYGHSVATAELQAWGKGLEPMLVPEARRKSLEEQAAEQKRKRRRG